MDRQAIEYHKKEMIAESIGIFEGEELSPSDVDITWKEREREDGSTILEMIATVPSTGEVLIQKTRNLTQLNG